jgi:IS6 family transposase
MSNGSWRVDETDVKVKGRWIYLHRAVDSRGQTIDFLLSAKRDAEAAKRFFPKALAQPHTVRFLLNLRGPPQSPCKPCVTLGSRHPGRFHDDPATPAPEEQIT